MKFGASVFVLGVLCSWHRASALNCNNTESMQREMVSCFTRLGLELRGTDTKDIQNVIQKDPELACRNPEGYKTALRCAMDLAKRCLAAVGQSPDILPNGDKMAEGVGYLCDHLHEVDLDCVASRQEGLKECGIAKARNIYSDNAETDILDVSFITCRVFEITKECMEETMASCPGRTMAVYVNYTQHMTPPACHRNIDMGGDKGPSYRFTTLAPVTSAGLVTMVPVLPHVSCYSETSIQAGQRTCFTREGIEFTLPKVTLSSGGQAKQSYLDGILANNKDINDICRDIGRYQRAMGCAMDVGRQCMPTGYKDYLPSARNMDRMLEDICDHSEDMNQPCVNGQASALFDCGYNKGKETHQRDTKGLLCSAFRWNAVCMQEVLPACGCRVTRLYSRLARLYLNPPACPTITTRDAQCVGDTDTFLSSANGARAEVFVLVTAVALGFVMRYFP